MRRKCRNCLCKTCMDNCCCYNCKEKIKECKLYRGFRQISIFDQTQEMQYQKAPRHSWEYYGISKARYRQLTEYIRSGRYASLASQAAHRANEMIAEYILLSVAKNKSYDALEKLWARGEVERIPYGKTDFYGIRRYFFSCFDKEMRRIGK